MASHDSENCDNDCAALKLRQHLSRLPQELYDEIYDLTFTAESKIRVYTKYGRWLANLRPPAPHVFSDRDTTFRGKLPPGFPVPPKNVFEREHIFNEQLPPVLQADRADRNAFSLIFFGERDSDWEPSESAKIPMQALDRVLSFNELPHLLHVDRASRQKFAESFFGNQDSVFMFWWTEDYKICIHKDHVRLMRDIRFAVSRQFHKTSLPIAKYLQRTVFRCIGDRFDMISNEEIVELVNQRIGVIDGDGVE
ncbi:uncharacterized protein RHO25_007258 [Cercospora beticola]|uniref:Uncharacterized protein n=1 Tax=Cercospora beticola TaxID=122368 RepID=A0ABZ0NSQ8_CERBT|nr:hypothetical protein RHO25_007258 [Cercospora beticola]